MREVTLTDIAAAVGMHKSAMLRSFETREQIFLAITAESWREWSTAVRGRLADLPHLTPDVVISTVTSMAGALWQMAAPGTRLRTLYESRRPELAHAVVDVEPQLTRILTALLKGMCATTTATHPTAPPQTGRRTPR